MRDGRLPRVEVPLLALVGAGAAGAVSALLGADAFAVGGVLLLVVIAWLAPSTVTVMLVAVASMCSGLQAPAAGFAPIIAWLLALVLLARNGIRQRPSLRLFTVFVCLGVTAHLSTVMVTVPSRRTDVVVSIVALVIASLAVVAVGLAAAPREIVTGTMMAGGLMVIGALLLGAFAPTTGLEMGRLRGGFVNANSVGLLAAVLIAAAVARRQRLDLFVALLATVAIVWSGSRTSAVAAVAALLWTMAVLLVRRRVWLVTTVTVVVAAASAVVLAAARLPEIPLFRSTNSRVAGIRYALESRSRSWVDGGGFESSPVEIASTPFRWFHDGGLLALLCVLAAYVLMLAAAARHLAPAGGLLVVGFVTSLFEGWLFAGGGAVFMAFWLLYHGLSLRVQERGDGAAAPADPPDREPASSRSGPSPNGAAASRALPPFDRSTPE